MAIFMIIYNQINSNTEASMYLTKTGFGPFADKKDEWWGDIIATDPTVGEDGKTVVGFKTYKYADEAVKAKTTALYIGKSQKGKPGFVGMYLSEDK